MIGVPYNHIDNDSLKEYFYRGQDNNLKTMLDIIGGGSYGECIYAEIAEKLEKISKTTRLGALGSRTLGETPL